MFNIMKKSLIVVGIFIVFIVVSVVIVVDVFVGVQLVDK